MKRILFDTNIYGRILEEEDENLIREIVVSEDNKTMLSEKSLKSYKIVNDIKKLRMPVFNNYKGFIGKIRRLI